MTLLNSSLEYQVIMILIIVLYSGSFLFLLCKLFKNTKDYVLDGADRRAPILLVPTFIVFFTSLVFAYQVLNGYITSSLTILINLSPLFILSSLIRSKIESHPFTEINKNVISSLLWLSKIFFISSFVICVSFTSYEITYQFDQISRSTFQNMFWKLSRPYNYNSYILVCLSLGLSFLTLLSMVYIRIKERMAPFWTKFLCLGLVIMIFQFIFCYSTIGISLYYNENNIMASITSVLFLGLQSVFVFTVLYRESMSIERKIKNIIPCMFAIEKTMDKFGKSIDIKQGLDFKRIKSIISLMENDMRAFEVFKNKRWKRRSQMDVSLIVKTWFDKSYILDHEKKVAIFDNHHLDLKNHELWVTNSSMKTIQLMLKNGTNRTHSHNMDRDTGQDTPEAV